MRLKCRALGKLQIKDEDVELSLRGDFGVQLPKRARRRVSGVGKKRLSGLLLRAVERFKAGPRHINLAPDDEPCGRVLEMQRNRAHGLEVLRYILADKPVAPCCAADKLAVDILQRHGKSVDLGLDTVHGFRLVFAEPFVKFPQLVERKHVLQALERHSVAHLHKLLKRLAADASGRAVGLGEFRILRLELFQAAQLPVIVVVRHLRRILHVV